MAHSWSPTHAKHLIIDMDKSTLHLGQALNLMLQRDAAVMRLSQRRFLAHHHLCMSAGTGSVLLSLVIIMESKAKR